jgi:hypothetical protein
MLNDTLLAFVPQWLVGQRLQQGWHLIPDYKPPYRGWAVLMMRPQ